MKIKSITHRWVLNTFGVITLVLVIINIIFIVHIKRYYYNYAEQTLALSAASNAHTIQSISNTSKGLNLEIRNLIENFSNSDKIVAIGLNFYGDVVASSDGILTNYSDYFYNYNNITSSLSDDTYNTEYLINGEHIMTYTKNISTTNSEFSAIIYVVSLNEIDSLIMNLIVILVIVSLLAIFFVIISGTFFVNSFVIPVREISTVVKKIANGNMKVRINKKSNHEIEELCSAINYMADELSNSEHIKNEFISSVSHELRTPLTAIKGWSETILNTTYNDKETLSKGMIVISKETARLSDMVEDLLDFSKIQNGQFHLTKNKMDIFAELEETILIYTDIAVRENKKLIYNEQSAVPVIYGDKNRIRQVFINIIDNAIKYSHQDDTITVDAFVDEDYVTIIINDTGCGIAKEDLQNITKKFFKANNTKKGSGIGLSVVEEIVKQHDGSLKFNSVENEGTKVTISFPLYKENDLQNKT